MNPSFNIATTYTGTGKPVLLVQAGRQGISLIQLDDEANTFFSVQVFHFTRHLPDNEIAASFNEILSAENLHQQHFKKIFVTWCFDESIMVPFEYFDANHNHAMLQLVYGDAVSTLPQHEMVLAHNLHTVYSIPVAVKNVFASRFPFCIQNHQNSLLINFEKVSRNLLYCIFYTNYFTVLLRKNGRLQAIQNFEFSSPEDVVYHLLNVCHSFEAPVPTTITVSGMIDANSNLYNELYKYFLQIAFADLPGNFNYTEDIKKEPAHYFSHLFATALCVL